jgi:hypothetical protein
MPWKAASNLLNVLFHDSCNFGDAIHFHSPQQRVVIKDPLILQTFILKVCCDFSAFAPERFKWNFGFFLSLPAQCQNANSDLFSYLKALSSSLGWVNLATCQDTSAW